MKSILFVDDERLILDELKKLFKPTDYLTYFASTREEALDILSKTRISVIVTDARMPGINGLQLLRNIK